MSIYVSKTEQDYPFGRRRKVGERFEVDSKDVVLLLALGRIEPEEGESRDDRQSYSTREMTAQPREKRGYNRKAA